MDTPVFRYAPRLLAIFPHSWFFIFSSTLVSSSFVAYILKVNKSLKIPETTTAISFLLIYFFNNVYKEVYFSEISSYEFDHFPLTYKRIKNHSL
jgi:hypothetical protein